MTDNDHFNLNKDDSNDSPSLSYNFDRESAENINLNVSSHGEFPQDQQGVPDPPPSNVQPARPGAEPQPFPVLGCFFVIFMLLAASCTVKNYFKNKFFPEPEVQQTAELPPQYDPSLNSSIPLSQFDPQALKVVRSFGFNEEDCVWEEGSLVELKFTNDLDRETVDLTQCQQLRKISIDPQAHIKIEVLDLSGLPNLQEINFAIKDAYSIRVESIKAVNCRELKSVDCTKNKYLQTLDLTGCAKLESVNCYYCEYLTSLVVDGCVGLQTLDCSECKSLQALDLKDCSNLLALDCCYCRGLTSLDLTPCPQLQTLNVRDADNLTDFDLTPVTNLQTLDCSYCDWLTSLDLTPCPNLRSLNCGGTDLTSLDLTPVPNLEELSCDIYEDLKSLDLTPCPNLKILKCGPWLEKILLKNASDLKVELTSYDDATFLAKNGGEPCLIPKRLHDCEFVVEPDVKTAKVEIYEKNIPVPTHKTLFTRQE